MPVESAQICFGRSEFNCLRRIFGRRTDAFEAAVRCCDARPALHLRSRLYNHTSNRFSVGGLQSFADIDTREKRLEEMQASFSQLSSSIQTIRAWLEAVGWRTMAAVIFRSRVA